MKRLAVFIVGAALLASCGQRPAPAPVASAPPPLVTTNFDDQPQADTGPAYVNCRWLDGRTMHADDLQRMMRDLERKTCRR